MGDFGLRPISHPPGMITPHLLPATAKLPAIDLQPVTTGPMQRAFTDITSVSFEIPFAVAQAVYAQDTAWQGDYLGFVGLSEGRPVSIVAIVPSKDVLGVYSLATHPNFRRRGFGEATLRAAVAEMEKRTGIKPVTLQSTEAGYPMYRRMGFRDVTRFTVYLTK